MKKIIFTFLLFSGMNAQAQLAPGSVAPDFTLTDINGVTHNLYDYLDQGKTVFIDVSATWCGPCWAFHSAGILDELWANHGPAGATGVLPTTTDDVMVLFIEGDGSTTSAELHGGAGSQGDWVTGVPYPIIDPASGIINSFNNSYDIAYFPTVYRICQNRIIDEPGQVSADELYASLNTCDAPAVDPSDVKFSTYEAATMICGPASYTPIVKFQNYGTSNLTSATITISQGGTTVSTGTYTGNLAPYEYATVNCTAISNYSGGTLDVEVTTPGESNTTNNTSSIVVAPAPEVRSRILLDIMTDNAAYTINWKIKDASGTVVPGTSDPVLANNTNYDFIYDLPSVGCYTYVISDQYADGIGSINLRDLDNVSLFTNANFGASVTVPFKVTSMINTAGLAEEINENIAVYPNPSKGDVIVKSENLMNFNSIRLVDQLGREVSTWNIDGTAMNLDLSKVANGSYQLVFSGDRGTQTQKIQVNH